MAAAAKHDSLRGLAPATFRPIVMPREATPSSTPRAGSRENSSRVARSYVVLPFPIRIGRLHGSLMAGADRIIPDPPYGISPTGNARSSGSERGVADHSGAVQNALMGDCRRKLWRSSQSA